MTEVAKVSDWEGAGVVIIDGVEVKISCCCWDRLTCGRPFHWHTFLSIRSNSPVEANNRQVIIKLNESSSFISMPVLGLERGTYRYGNAKKSDSVTMAQSGLGRIWADNMSGSMGLTKYSFSRSVNTVLVKCQALSPAYSETHVPLSFFAPRYAVIDSMLDLA